MATTAIHVPQWMIDFHRHRLDFFLKYIEPIIVTILGPVTDYDAYADGYGYTDPIYRSAGYTTTTTTMDPYTLAALQRQQEQQFIDHTHRRLGFLPDYVSNVSAVRETSMSFATLAMLFTIMSSVLVVFLSCFYHNQKTSPLFISPRRNRLPKLVPPPLPVDGTFSWIKVCFYISDEEIMERIGFDSLIFLRFHRLALRCIVKMSVVSFFIILPLNFTGGGHANASDLKGYVGSLLFTDFLRFTMANVTGGSPRLWVHCFAAYLLSAIVMRELVIEYNAFNNIRHRYMLSKEPHLRTVLVSNIPRHLRSPKKIGNYFKHVYPDAVKSVTICQNLIKLENLVNARTKILSKIEKELLFLCRAEKRKLMGIDPLQGCGTSSVKYIENLGILSGASERLGALYSRLEDLNIEIQHEQTRRERVMKRLDKMDSRRGRKDIDYILATPFIDEESAYTSSKASSIPSTIVEEEESDDNSKHMSEAARFNYVQFSENKKNEIRRRKRRPFAKAKQAIKRYSRSVMDVNLIGKKKYSDDANFDPETSNLIEHHINEVSDKAFIEMKTFTASTIAIQSMHSSKPGAMEVVTSPEPRDVLWQNVYISKGAKKTRGLIGETLIILLIAFYVVPVALVSLLVSESALVSSSPRLAQLDQASAFFSSALAMVQPICLTVIQQLLPPLFIQISKAEGLISFSEVQMKAFSRYFMFQVLNVFLVTAIAGSIFDTLAIILVNPEAAFEMLGNSLPRMSSFFITFVTVKCFFGLGVELVRTLSIVQNGIRYILFSNSTVREKRQVRIGMRAIDDPGWFPFHKILAQDMLVVVISVVFAVVAPIVLLPCALFCLFSRIMWTHHHLYVFESVFESGGQFWPKIFRRFVFGLIIAQMTITGQFILKEARHEAYATMILMVLTYSYLRSTRSRYDGPSSTLPLEVATIMDITVAQEEEEKMKQKDNSNQSETYAQIFNSDSYEVTSNHIGDVDPFQDAYCQPALRANPRARPEQPFPPAQLGKEDLFLNRPILKTPEDAAADKKATVRLKSLNQRDRNSIDEWWNQQLRACDEKKFFRVLVGEESGNLRLGKKNVVEESRLV